MFFGSRALIIQLTVCGYNMQSDPRKKEGEREKSELKERQPHFTFRYEERSAKNMRMCMRSCVSFRVCVLLPTSQSQCSDKLTHIHKPHACKIHVCCLFLFISPAQHTYSNGTRTTFHCQWTCYNVRRLCSIWQYTFDYQRFCWKFHRWTDY